jgi:hypothetical protein
MRDLHEPQTHPRDDDRQSPYNHLLWSTSILVFAFVLYILSTGPVARFYEPPAKPVAFDAVQAFYWPLTQLAEHSVVARRFFDWYLRVWGVDVNAGYPK